MSSYLSGLLTTTTSRYASFRGLISTSDTDGDTPDDTHLCRVLRGYYIEKGRPFPGWLPPDPKAPQPVQPAYAQPNPQIGAGYGGGGLQPGQSKLGSLWGDNSAQSATGGAQSLRQGGGRGMGGGANSLRPGAAVGRDPYNRSQTQSVEPIVQARPLPSQRAGSYQAGPTPPGSSGSATGGNTAQDRLKARLWGAARAASPTLAGAGGQGANAPPVQQAAAAFSRTNSYGSSGGASSNYEDSFLPGARTGGGGGGGSGGGDRPFVAATAPWASSENEFTGAGYGGNAPRQAPQRQGGGLPSGPRRGLPGGPRPVR